MHPNTKLKERRAIVLMVDLANARASSRYNLSQISGQMVSNSRSAGLYWDASLGQVHFPADSDGDGAPAVSGPFAVPYDSSTCNYYDWAAAASLAPTSLTLAAGQSAAATFSVRPLVAEGRYALTVTATDVDGLAPHHAAAGAAAATLTIDGTPPRVPSGLAASVSRQGKVSLSWKAASDGLSGVAAYLVYRDGAPIAQMSSLSFTDSRLVMGTTYRYAVAARDGAGNVSSPSAPLAVTVSGKPGRAVALR